jgi:hypothetical protein
VSLISLVAIPAMTVQTGSSSIHIHEILEPQQTTTTAGNLGLSLQTTFSLLDGEGQVLRADIESASFELQGDTYPATVEELETPWSLVFLIDASKTLGTGTASATWKSARGTVAGAIGGLPEGANIAILKFDDTAPTVQEFSQARDRLAAAVQGLTPKPSGGSCLYDGVYQAVNKLGGAPGRRAAVVFTASADNCGNRTLSEVLGLADQNRVQIYPVGLVGYAVTLAELEALAGPTGGIAEFRDQATLTFGLANVSAVLSNQWTARATVYPSAGQQATTLTLDLSGDISLTSAPITFVSTQDYVPPAEIHLRGRVLSVAEGIVFNLDIIQPQKIRQLNVSIISSDTGQAVLSQSLITFSDVNTIPTASLIAGGEYTLIVSAIDANGRLLYEANGEFTYEPPPARVNIAEVQVPNADQPDFLVSVSTQNLTGVVKFRGWLAEGESNVPVEGTERVVPLGEPLLLPADGIASGTYAVVVQALDVADTVLAESAPVKFSYTRPSPLESLQAFVRNSPAAVAALTGFFCLAAVGAGVVIWLIIPKRGTRPVTVDLVMPQKARRPAPGSERTPSNLAVVQPAPAVERPPAYRDRPTPQPGFARAGQKPEAAPPAPAMPAARITLIHPASPSFSAEMRSSPFSVGRREGNDAVVPLDSSSGVSGKHFRITFENGQFLAHDEKSTFGTTLDGTPLVHGRPMPLRDGSVIGLGPQVKVRFNLG